MSTAILTELKPESEYLSQTAAALAPALPFPKSDSAQVQTSAPARQRRAASARRRRVRLDWEAIGVILLILTCIAVGLYRLLWMGQI